MPAFRMGRKEDILRRHDPRKHRRNRFEGEHARGRDAVTGIRIETLPLSRSQVISTDCSARGDGELQRMQPDTSQQQKHHGEADQRSAPRYRGNAVIALSHESWKSSRCVEQLVSFYTNSGRVTNVTHV